jgi:hypothetical protein
VSFQDDHCVGPRPATSATRWHDRIGHEQIFMAKTRLRALCTQAGILERRIRLDWARCVDVDTLMGVLDQGRCRCIDCLCFWAPSKHNLHRPSAPPRAGVVSSGAIACPHLLRFNGPMPRGRSASSGKMAGGERESREPWRRVCRQNTLRGDLGRFRQQIDCLPARPALQWGAASSSAPPLSRCPRGIKKVQYPCRLGHHDKKWALLSYFKSVGWD